MSSIFISHSSIDSDLAARIAAWLEDEGFGALFLDFDPRFGIPAGRDWERELYRKISASRAILVLHSENWVESRWCFAELTLARSLGKHIFPLLIDQTPIHRSVSDRQAVDLGDGETTALRRLSQDLATAVYGSDVFAWDPNRAPYPGLLSFQEADAAVYFGRESDISRSLDLVNRLRRYGEAGLLLILGASGSGKSSLLRAGILPRLRRAESHWTVLPTFRPTRRPFAELSNVISRAYQVRGVERDWESILEQLAIRGDEPLDALADRLYALLEDVRRRSEHPESTTVISIDQLEEAVTGGRGSEGARFLELIATLCEEADRSLLLLSTLRSDFLERIQRTTPLLGPASQELFLSPISTDGMRRLIEEPARVAGIELEQGLVDVLMNDAQTDDSLPLLAFTLRELYDGYGRDGLLEVSEYRDSLGGLRGSIATAADAVLTASNPSEDQRDNLRKAFLRLVRVNEEGHYAKVVAHWSDLPEDIHPILERFVQARLLISGADDEGPTLEVAHEALFRVWDQLRRWLDENQESLRIGQEIDQATSRWIRSGRSEEYLWRGGRLNRASELQTAGLVLSDPEAEEFIAASEATEARVRSRRLRARRTLLAGALVTAAAMALLAYLQTEARAEADQQRRMAQSGELALESVSAAEQSVDLALLLGVQALEVAATPDAQASLLSGLQGNPFLRNFLHTKPSFSVGDLSFRRDGRHLATVGGREIHVFDLDAGQPVGPPLMTGPEGIMSSTLNGAYDPTGRFFAATQVSGTLQLWDMERRAHVWSVDTGMGLMSSRIGFDRDGTRIVLGGCGPTPSDVGGLQCEAGGGFSIWRVEDGSQMVSRSDSELPRITSTRFSPSGGHILAGTRDGSILVWDLTTMRRRRIAAHGAEVSDIEVSPRGTLFASASEDGTVRTWRLERATSPEVREVMSVAIGEQSGPVSEIAFGAEGAVLASAGSDGEIVIWSLERGLDRILLVDAGVGGVDALAFHPTEPLLASAATNGRIVLWDLLKENVLNTVEYLDSPIESLVKAEDDAIAVGLEDGGVRLVGAGDAREPLLVIEGRSPRSGPVALSPDGHLLAHAPCVDLARRLLPICDGSRLDVWDPGSRQVLWTGDGQGGVIESLAVSPDGSSIVSGREDGELHVWDARTGASWPLAPSHSGAVRDLSFSPDGSHFVSAGMDGRLLLWNASTRSLTQRLLDGGSGTMLAAAFSPDGRILAAGGGDKVIHLWDLESMLPAGPPLDGHSESIFDLDFDATGEVLASGSYDGEIRLWSVDGQSRIGTLTTHRDAVTGVAFVDAGLVSADRGGLLVRWQLDRRSWVQTACSVANRNLSLSEWRQYMDDAPYEKTCDENVIHPSLVEWAEELALRGDAAGARRVLDRILEQEPGLGLDPDSVIRRQALVALGRRAARLTEEERYEEAIEAHRDLERLDGIDLLTADDWNGLCWRGSLAGFAADVLFACEHAVDLAQPPAKAHAMDSRGLARSLTGDFDGAISDFTAFVEWSHRTRMYTGLAEKRERWIRALDAGTNPFDSLTLVELRTEGGG